MIKKDLENIGKYAVFQNSLKPLGFFDKYNFPKNSTFIIGAGAAGEIGYSNVDFWAADDVFVFENTEAILSRFLYFFLLTKQKYLFSRVRKASIPRLSRSDIERIQIPIPPLTTQQKIVEILDKFDTLTHSISEGLPREIELRRKQYEYYREQLLNFPKAV